MLFNGGMTASYIVWTRLFHIKDTLWAYLLPGSLMNGMNVMLVRNYFNANIPYSIVEAARIDGANDWTIYSKIMVPLSKPIMTTIGLFYQVPLGNGMLYETTQTIDTFVYRALMVSNNVGQSSAASVFQAVIGFFLVLFSNLLVRKINPENSLF